MQYSAEFIILAPPFDSNFQITWQKITSWEKWILRIKPRWLPFILDSPTSAPRGQRLLLQPVQKPGNNPRVPVLLILDILWWRRYTGTASGKIRRFESQMDHLFIHPYTSQQICYRSTLVCENPPHTRFFFPIATQYGLNWNTGGRAVFI